MSEGDLSKLFQYMKREVHDNTMDILRNIDEIEDINLSSGEEEEMQIRFPKRYIRDGQNPFEFYNEWEFKRRFRFAKDSVMFRILPLIEEGLSKVNNRGLPIAPVLQLLISLRFYATASFQVSNEILLYFVIKYSKYFFI